jgi:hypothetical protein
MLYSVLTRSRPLARPSAFPSMSLASPRLHCVGRQSIQPRISRMARIGEHMRLGCWLESLAAASHSVAAAASQQALRRQRRHLTFSLGHRPRNSIALPTLHQRIRVYSWSRPGRGGSPEPPGRLGQSPLPKPEPQKQKRREGFAGSLTSRLPLLNGICFLTLYQP